MSPGALLDTHILIWWRQGSGKLSKPQAQLLAELERRGEPAFISAITLWELAKMVERGRLAPRELITETIPLDQAFGVIEKMSNFENVGISVINQF